MSLFGDQKDEFVTSLAALALYDGDAEISSENIATLLAATNNTVAPYWPVLFAGLLKNGRIETLVFSGGAGGGGGAAPAAGKFFDALSLSPDITSCRFMDGSTRTLSHIIDHMRLLYILFASMRVSYSPDRQYYAASPLPLLHFSINVNITLFALTLAPDNLTYLNINHY